MHDLHGTVVAFDVTRGLLHVTHDGRDAQIDLQKDVHARWSAYAPHLKRGARIRYEKAGLMAAVVRHPAPTVDGITFDVMRRMPWVIGTSDHRRRLMDEAVETASIEDYDDWEGCIGRIAENDGMRLSTTMRRGTLSIDWRHQEGDALSTIQGSTLTLPALPATVVNAMPGRPIGEFARFPLLTGDEIVERATVTPFFDPSMTRIMLKANPRPLENLLGLETSDEGVSHPPRNRQKYRK